MQNSKVNKYIQLNISKIIRSKINNVTKSIEIWVFISTLATILFSGIRSLSPLLILVFNKMVLNGV